MGMKLNLVDFTIFGVGALLITAAIRDTSPRQLITDSISGSGLNANRVPTPPANAATGYSIDAGAVNPITPFVVTSN